MKCAAIRYALYVQYFISFNVKLIWRHIYFFFFFGNFYNFTPVQIKRTFIALENLSYTIVWSFIMFNIRVQI